jgi:hypothetical protein
MGRGGRAARAMPTLATIVLSRRWGTQVQWMRAGGAELVGGGLLSVVDDERFDGALGGVEF